MIYSTTELQVEVLTPTHIGMGQEKNYLRGLDFIIKDNPDDNGKSLYILRPEKVMEQVAQSPKDLHALTLSMSTGKYEKIESLLNRLEVLKNKNVLRVEIAYDDSMTEIKRQFSNGLGNYLIPGSSLKGSIRSVLYNNLKRQNPRANRDEQMFGKIGDNLMSLLTVGDVAIPDPDNVKIYRTKVYSADKKPEEGLGQWKHARVGGHSKSFESEGFVSHYEAIKPKTRSSVRIGIGNNVPVPKLASIPNSNFLYQSNITTLLAFIKDHTRTYLNREIEYYRTYSNDDLGQIAISKLQSLLNQNAESNSCVLRVGANVGFHAITGDWQSDSHTDGWHFNKQSRTEQIKAKTRKFAFTKKLAGGFDFHPMGFIKLSLSNP